MSSIRNFLNEENFSSGLPEGDTIINIDEYEIERKDFDGKTRYFMHTKSNDKEGYFVPKTVFGSIKKLLEKEENKEKTKVRITRTGTGQKDTRYTVVMLE